MNKKTILSLLLGIGILAGGYVYFFVWNKAHPEYADLKADHELQAQELFDAFTTDAESASLKYNGKMILLAGDVNKVEQADSLTIAVYVFSEGMFGDEGIRCTFLSSDELKNLSSEDLKGKRIKGYCTGYNDTDVILENCSIVNN